MIEQLNSVPVLNLFIPDDPQLVVERDPQGKILRYSLDADTEKYLQRQRMFAMVVGGPTVVYAGFKMNAPWWQRIPVMGLGVACTLHHFYAWQTVRAAEKE